MAIDVLERALEADETRAMTELCQHIVGQCHGDMDRNFVAGVDSVNTAKVNHMDTELLWDGYERDDFVAAHQQCTPEELRVSPFMETRPGTDEQVPVFYVPASPHWRKTLRVRSEATCSTSQMENQV